MLTCRVLEPDDWCHDCGAQGVARDTVVRPLAHVQLGWRPTVLQLRVRRYGCTGCRHVWRQDTTAAAAPRATLSRLAVLWALKSVVIDRLSIARVAASLGMSRHTVNDAVLAAGRALGVDEHCWRTPTTAGNSSTSPRSRDGIGSARLLDMVSGRSKQVFTTWLNQQSPFLRAGVEAVPMDGFTGYKIAAAEALTGRRRGHGSLSRRRPRRGRPEPLRSTPFSTAWSP